MNFWKSFPLYNYKDLVLFKLVVGIEKTKLSLWTSYIMAFNAY